MAPWTVFAGGRVVDERAGLRATGAVRVGRRGLRGAHRGRRDPALDDDVDVVVVLDLVGDDQVAGRAALDVVAGGVLPEARVLVELEREEDVAARVLAVEGQVEEGVAGGLVDVVPGVEEVRLGRRDAVRVEVEVPVQRVVLVGAGVERRVQRVRVGGVHEAREAGQVLPVDVRRVRRRVRGVRAGRGIGLVAVAALEVGARQREVRRLDDDGVSTSSQHREDAEQREERDDEDEERPHARRERHQRNRAEHVRKSLPARLTPAWVLSRRSAVVSLPQRRDGGPRRI